MTGLDILTEQEVADLLHLKPSQVRRLGRDGELRRVPPMRPPRYDRASVEEYGRRPLFPQRKAYDARDESRGAAPAEAAAPGRGDGRAAPGPLASQALGGGGAVPRRYGPSAGDVVVRRVQG